MLCVVSCFSDDCLMSLLSSLCSLPSFLSSCSSWDDGCDLSWRLHLLQFQMCCVLVHIESFCLLNIRYICCLCCYSHRTWAVLLSSGQEWTCLLAFLCSESLINMAPKKRYYALAKAKEVGIFFDYWGNMKHLTQGTSKPIYRG